MMNARIGIAGALACIGTLAMAGSAFGEDGQARRDASEESPVPVPEHLLAELETESVPAAKIIAVKSHGPLKLLKAKPVDEEGKIVDAPVVLETVGPAVIGSEAVEPIRVGPDYAVQVGDTIGGGVVENRGPTAVRLSFSDNVTHTLDPGISIYVGTRKRLLTLAEEGVVILTTPKRTREACVCRCSACDCAVDLGGLDEQTCGAQNGKRCESDGRFGSLSSCQITVIVETD